MTSGKNYTIADIARELGLHKATVSRALSGKGKLSEATREKVLACAREHNYRPNAVAQSLARSRTYTLGLMIPGNSGAFNVAFFRDCLQGICSIAGESGYDVMVTMDMENPVDQMLRLIENRKVDGVIAMRSLVGSPVAHALKEKDIPFVLVGSTDDPDTVWVDNDNYSACRAMTDHLIAGGARQMALLGGSDAFCVTHTREIGFLFSCSVAGLSPSKQLIRLGMTDRVSVDNAVDEILRRDIDCIVCMDDYISNMALASLHSRGVNVPGDVKLASFYDNTLLENHTPSVTAIRFDAMELGREACRSIISLLENGAAENRMLDGFELMIRESTR